MILLKLTKSLVRPDRQSYKGLCLFEIAMLAYLAVTTACIVSNPHAYVTPDSMLSGRLWCMVTTLIGLGAYIPLPPGHDSARSQPAAVARVVVSRHV